MTHRPLNSVAVIAIVAVVFAGAVVLLASGCASLPACPARGGPAWIELTTAHFTVRTDLDDTAARGVIHELEETRAAMLDAVWPDAPGPPDRLPVVALASQSELRVFTGPRIEGIWAHRAPFAATILIGGYRDDDRRAILRHELAHHLSRWFLPQQPIWFAEGIATFLETIHYDREHQRAVVGEPSWDRFNTLRTGMFSTSRLLTGEQPDMAEMALFESTSWLLVHYLINQRELAFQRFQRRVGAFERPQEAWAAELGDLDATHLLSTLDDYVAAGNYNVLRIPMRPWSGPIQVRPMLDAEVHGARAFMYAVGNLSRTPAPDSVRDARVRAEVDEALSADPAGALEALAVKYYALGVGASPEQQRALAERASRAHPDSELAWLMMADSAPLGDGRFAQQTALARALALAPNDPEALIRMAFIKASNKKWDEAVEFSRKAIRLRALNPQALRTHVAALAMTGQCREAAFYVAGLRRPSPRADPNESAVPAGWLELQDRCLRVAAARAKPTDEAGAAGATVREPE
jgi:tetratricopeptide (TPR) repeat protein